MKHIILSALAVAFCCGQMCGVPAPQAPLNGTGGSQSSNTVPSYPDTSTARRLVGPGFFVTVPAGFSPMSPPALAVPVSFVEAYSDGVRAIVLSVQPGVGGGQSSIEGISFRVQCRQLTSTGDFVLVAAIEANDSSMADALAAYALLANGDLLCVEVDAFGIGTTEQVLGMGVFQSIDLESTDGRLLEQRWQQQRPKLLDHTANDLIVLDDLSAWGLPYAPTPDESREFMSWQIGDAIHTQSYGSSSKQYELVQVGRWVPIRTVFMGMAIRSQIMGISPDRATLTLANGRAYSVYPYEVPAGWIAGDEVLMIDGTMASISTTVINRTIDQVFEF